MAELTVGSNPISSLEVVSSLNSFNLTNKMFSFNVYNRTEKFAPKLYLGSVQTMSDGWIFDNNPGLSDAQKSGS